MRNGAAALALVLAACAVGCRERADPAPSAVSQQTSGLSKSAAPLATASVTAEAAPAPALTVPTGASPVPARLRALGTEPFWNARIDGEALTYTTPEDQKGRRTTVARRDRPTGAEFSGKLGGTPIHLAVTSQICSDGMSDRSYPFTAVLTLGSDRREGCAS